MLEKSNSPTPDHRDNSDDNLQTDLQSIPVPGIGAISGSDDSDNDELAVQFGEYGGYQPLSLGDQIDENDYQSEMETEDIDFRDQNVEGVVTVESDQVTVDTEIETEVWNAPRPQELNIELDSTKTAQIMSAMSKITLPEMAIPEWAQGVPEDKWKDKLLEQIRQRQLIKK